MVSVRSHGHDLRIPGSWRAWMHGQREDSSIIMIPPTRILELLASSRLTYEEKIPSQSWRVLLPQGFVSIALEEEGELLTFVSDTIVELASLSEAERQCWQLAAHHYNLSLKLGRIAGHAALRFDLRLWFNGNGVLTEGQFLRALTVAIGNMLHSREILEEHVSSLTYAVPPTRYRIPAPHAN